ncbi:MAG: DUF4373 domain-containing protein [Bacteroidales bacterium]|nr:DUF4373 domain-containing protein [Bacteroidales bacterium]
MKWFKHYTNMGNDPRYSLLNEQLGPRGVGLYWLIMEQLHLQERRACYRKELVRSFVSLRITRNFIRKVIDDYGLFVTDRNGFLRPAATPIVNPPLETHPAIEGEAHPAPYKNAPQPGEGKAVAKPGDRKAVEEPGDERAVTGPRDGRATATSSSHGFNTPNAHAYIDTERELEREEERKEETNNDQGEEDGYNGRGEGTGYSDRSEGTDNNGRSEEDSYNDNAREVFDELFRHEPWHPYVTTLFGDRSVWRESVLLQSPYRDRLRRYWPIAVFEFAKHIAALDTGTRIASVSEARHYFANFVREHLPCGRELRLRLDSIEESRKETRPSVFQRLAPTGYSEFPPSESNSQFPVSESYSQSPVSEKNVESQETGSESLPQPDPIAERV